MQQRCDILKDEINLNQRMLTHFLQYQNIQNGKQCGEWILIISIILMQDVSTTFRNKKSPSQTPMMEIGVILIALVPHYRIHINISISIIHYHNGNSNAFY